MKRKSKQAADNKQGFFVLCCLEKMTMMLMMMMMLILFLFPLFGPSELECNGSSSSSSYSSSEVGNYQNVRKENLLQNKNTKEKRKLTECLFLGVHKGCGWLYNVFLLWRNIGLCNCMQSAAALLLV